MGGLRSGLGCALISSAARYSLTALVWRCSRDQHLIGRLAVIAAGVRRRDTGVDRKAFALDQARIHADLHHGL